jgi:hypothetical protein
VRWWQEEFLTKATPDKNLVRLLICMGEAMRTIAFKVRTASCGGTACVNSFGDEQLAVDMLANKLLFDVCSYSDPLSDVSNGNGLPSRLCISVYSALRLWNTPTSASMPAQRKSLSFKIWVAQLRVMPLSLFFSFSFLTKTGGDYPLLVIY